MGMAYTNFQENVHYLKHLGGLSDSLTYLLTKAVDLTDLRRAQIVFAVSAVDALVHDILVEASLEMHQGSRAIGPLYMEMCGKLKEEGRSITVTAIQYEVYRRFDNKTLQRSYSIERTLALVGCCCNWSAMEEACGMEADSIKRYLNIIVDRRNRICHAADRDPVDATRKLDLSATDAEMAAQFIGRFGNCLLLQTGLVEKP